MKSDAELRVVSYALGHAVFSLLGRTDFDNVGRLLSLGQKAFSEHENVTIKIADADCANTAGLALLIEWYTWCLSSNIKLIYDSPADKLLEFVDANDVSQVLSFSS